MAQKRYAAINPEGNAQTTYARHLKSLPGKKDGLYWPAAENEPASPFGPLVAEAQAEGYIVHPRALGRTRSTVTISGSSPRRARPLPAGAMDYLTDGKLTRGFALVAYPVEWGQSGIMTFIVNQDGKVYQRDLGEKTDELAPAMKEYNPDGSWTLVEDKGVNGVMMAPVR